MQPGHYFVGDNVDMKTGVRQIKKNQRKEKCLCCFEHNI